MSDVRLKGKNIQGIMKLSSHPNYCDIFIHTRDNGVVGVPKLLLLLGSSFCRSIFDSMEGSLESNFILLPGFDKSVVEDCIEYLTHGILKSSSKDRIKTLVDLLRLLKIPFESIDEKQGKTCEFCGKILKDKYSLKSHISVMHLNSEKSFECPVCCKKFRTKGNVKTHLSVHGGKKFICETCGLLTKTKHALSIHLETHNKVRRYQCDFCPKSFPVKTYLTYHHQTAHSESRPFPCPDCGKAFKLERQVRYHRRQVHDTAKDIQCLICSYSCAQMPKMTTHLIVHSGTKPYHCSQCSETFKHKEEGRRHAKAKHPSSQVSIKFVINEAITKLSETAIKRAFSNECQRDD